MPLDKIVVILAGIAGILFIFWFFLMKKDKTVDVENSINITVDGGYSPSTIAIPRGKTTKIIFTRKDPSSCLEDVILPEFKVKKFLPMNKPVVISLTPQNTGTYEIVCGMNMFHGKILVKEPTQKEG